MKNSNHHFTKPVIAALALTSIAAFTSTTAIAQNVVDVTVTAGRVDIEGSSASESLSIVRGRAINTLVILGNGDTMVSVDGREATRFATVPNRNTLRIRLRGGADELDARIFEVRRLVIAAGGGDDQISIDNVTARTSRLFGGRGFDTLSRESSSLSVERLSGFEVDVADEPQPEPIPANGILLTDANEGIGGILQTNARVSEIIVADPSIIGQRVFIDNFAPNDFLDVFPRDFIDISRLDADTTRPGDQGFRLVSSFSGAAGELTMEGPPTGGDVNVTQSMRGDVDGDGVADFEIVFVINGQTIQNIANNLIN